MSATTKWTFTPASWRPWSCIRPRAARSHRRGSRCESRKFQNTWDTALRMCMSNIPGRGVNACTPQPSWRCFCHLRRFQANLFCTRSLRTWQNVLFALFDDCCCAFRPVDCHMNQDMLLRQKRLDIIATVCCFLIPVQCVVICVSDAAGRHVASAGAAAAAPARHHHRPHSRDSDL